MKSIDALGKIDTPTVANAIEALDIRNRATGFCDRRMRQLTPEMGVLCGYAVTVQAVTMTAEPFGREEGVETYLEICASYRAVLVSSDSGETIK